MAAFIVRTPVAGATDTVGAVHFSDGVAQVDDETHAAELRYFRQAGYVVDPVEAEESRTSRGRRAASKDEETPK
jgi:hypothetical protein